MKLTASELRIWEAVYAARFVSEFASSEAVRSAIPDRPANPRDAESPFDCGVRCTHAEAPATVADLAVLRLREWTSGEGYKPGDYMEYFAEKKR